MKRHRNTLRSAVCGPTVTILGIGTLLLFGSGCSTTAPNARAIRMFTRERPTPKLLRDHINEMNEALRQTTAVMQAPYQPGAPWVADLVLDDARAEQTRRILAESGESPSFVAIYAAHLRNVVAKAQAVRASGVPNAVAAAVPNGPTIMSALADINPNLTGQGAAVRQNLAERVEAAQRAQAMLEGAENPDTEAVGRAQAEHRELSARLAALDEQLLRPVGPAILRQPTDARVIDDAITITSVAIRMVREAISLATVVALEAASISESPGNWLKGAPDSVRLAAELPDDARETYRQLQAALASMQAMFAMLRQLKRVDLEDTAAFRFKDGLVDEIVGLSTDSVHFDLQGGGEALFYNAIADKQNTTNSNGDTIDYTGRLTKLEYRVQPIVLASARLSLKMDLPHWADAVGLKLGYATNRVYKSGGEVENGSFANELGIKNSFSDAMDAALAIAGVRAGVKIAHFTHGTVRDVLYADNSVLAEAPFGFDMKQIDVGYDLAPQSGQLIQALTIGFRYFDYTLPRILYELTNSTPGAEHAAYVYSRETPPQRMRTRYYMLSLTSRIERTFAAHFRPYLNVDFAVGYGPTRYYFLRDPNALDVSDNQDYTSSASLGLGLAGALGLRWCVGGPESRFNAYFDGYYQIQSISSTFANKSEGNTLISIGATDLFHGPRAAFGAMF